MPQDIIIFKVSRFSERLLSKLQILCSIFQDMFLYSKLKVNHLIFCRRMCLFWTYFWFQSIFTGRFVLQTWVHLTLFKDFSRMIWLYFLLFYLSELVLVWFFHFHFICHPYDPFSADLVMKTTSGNITFFRTAVFWEYICLKLTYKAGICL